VTPLPFMGGGVVLFSTGRWIGRRKAGRVPVSVLHPGVGSCWYLPCVSGRGFASARHLPPRSRRQRLRGSVGAVNCGTSCLCNPRRQAARPGSPHRRRQAKRPTTPGSAEESSTSLLSRPSAEVPLASAVAPPHYMRGAWSSRAVSTTTVRGKYLAIARLCGGCSSRFGVTIENMIWTGC
jgi:hypothetical protein